MGRSAGHTPWHFVSARGAFSVIVTTADCRPVCGLHGTALDRAVNKAPTVPRE